MPMATVISVDYNEQDRVEQNLSARYGMQWVNGSMGITTFAGLLARAIRERPKCGGRVQVKMTENNTMPAHTMDDSGHPYPSTGGRRRRRRDYDVWGVAVRPAGINGPRKPMREQNVK